MNKQWNILKTNTQAKEKLKQINDEKGYKLNDIILTYLANHGINNQEELERYINPSRDSFYDPFLMIDMEKAVDRILLAIDRKEKITIYGDYDVDGLTSSSILSNFLQSLGVDVDIYIPNRLDEGYGLNISAIETIAKTGCNLLITVDCGITAIKEVEFANSLGIEVIVTDHHEAQKEIPNCVAVVDNKRKESTYPFSELAGCGVAFKLIMAISLVLNLEPYKYLKYLDIVCIGTIADIVPLQDENRVIAKLGIKLLNQTKNMGLYKLIQSLEAKDKTINSNAISFGIAPRINACGRLGDEKIPLDLFNVTNMIEADEIVAKLNEYNKQRQDIEKEIFQNAIELIEDKDLKKDKIIILSGKDWHHGVIGIVASKIVEKYNKPVILLSEEDGVLKGSGRSIKDFNLFEALSLAGQNLETFGGHAMAIGLSLKKENLESFTQDLNKQAIEMGIDKIVPTIDIDMEVDLEKLNIEDVEDLKQLEPFGQKNTKPIFIFRNVTIDSIRTLSEGQHLKLGVKKGNTLIDCIGFKIRPKGDNFLIGDKIDIIGNLEINEFNNLKNIQISIKDLRKSVLVK